MIKGHEEGIRTILSHYGDADQRLKLIEEMAELTQAIIKDHLNPTVESYYNMIDELADVLIVISQIELCCEGDYLSTVISNKITRTIGNIKIEKGA